MLYNSKYLKISTLIIIVNYKGLLLDIYYFYCIFAESINSE